MQRIARRVLVLIPALAVALTSCGSFTWKGRGSGVDKESAELGIKDPVQLKADYDAERYWSFWRNNWDGRMMAIRRDFHMLHQSIDRHFFNYDWNDPYLYH